jgi:hypothetical protein
VQQTGLADSRLPGDYHEWWALSLDVMLEQPELATPVHERWGEGGRRRMVLVGERRRLVTHPPRCGFQPVAVARWQLQSVCQPSYRVLMRNVPHAALEGADCQSADSGLLCQLLLGEARGEAVVLQQRPKGRSPRT